MGEGIKSLDFFRFTPTKLLEQTLTGAISIKKSLKLLKKNSFSSSDNPSNLPRNSRIRGPNEQRTPIGSSIRESPRKKN